MALAARAVARMRLGLYEDWYISLGQMGLVFALLAFTWLNVSWLINANPGGLASSDMQIHLGGLRVHCS